MVLPTTFSISGDTSSQRGSKPDSLWVLCVCVQFLTVKLLTQMAPKFSSKFLKSCVQSCKKAGFLVFLVKTVHWRTSLVKFTVGVYGVRDPREHPNSPRGEDYDLRSPHHFWLFYFRSYSAGCWKIWFGPRCLGPLAQGYNCYKTGDSWSLDLKIS